jgi:predicted O-methyltransferase YrrM
MNHHPQTRAEIATMIPSGGIVIELGVAAGAFAVEMLKANPSMLYLGIDRWADHHDLGEMELAWCAINQFNAERIRAQISRMSFADAVTTIPDNYADMIYIDGYAHTGQDNGRTLDEWWPKLKPGGIFSGHDYCGEYHQTVTQVDRFAHDHGLTIHTTADGPNFSWWTIKPTQDDFTRLPCDIGQPATESNKTHQRPS